jgi:hypothetical protein
MVRKFVTALLLTLLVAAVAQAKGKEPPKEILGIRVGMSQSDAHGRLRKAGRLEKEERKRQEVWALSRDRRFGHIIIGFDADNKVRYVTALARPDGRRVRYSDLADVGRARQLNGVKSYHYEWEVAGHDKRPAYVVMARGTDPQFLSSLSLKKLD